MQRTAEALLTMDEAQRVIAQALKWSMADVRALIEELESAGVYVQHIPTTGDLCPNCASHYATERTGFCVRCTTDMELERQREEDRLEEERLREEATRERNVVKKQRERMREEHGANPRKGARD